MNSKSIQLTIQQRFSSSDFLLNVDCRLPLTGVTAIFGQSGSGKTTLLRCIAGLESTDNGVIKVGDHVWQDASRSLPTHKRTLGYVFQESSLLPHLNVKQNLEFGMKRRNRTSANHDHAQHILSMLGIESLLDRSPAQLSGGERQRVSIARALLPQPDLLLMDEPLASLDDPRKQEILKYLERLHESIRIPILYVSHSVDEVARLADHVIVMEQGRIKHQGNVMEVFSELALPLNDQQDTSVILQGQIVEKDTQWHLAKVTFNGGELWIKDNGEALDDRIRIRVLAKDVSIALSEHGDSSILNKLDAIVDTMIDDDDPAMTLVKLKLSDTTMYARLTKRSANMLNLKSGQRVSAQIKSVAIVR